MGSKENELNAARQRIEQEMLNNADYQTYFGQYREDSVLSFVQSYARHKANLEVYGDYTQYNQRYLTNTWQTHAWAALQQIQMKKLFDLVCQWNAELIPHLPGVQIMADLSDLEKRILDYEGVPDITEEDIQFYLKYLDLANTNFEFSSDFVHRARDHDQIRDQYAESRDTDLAYYNFHMLHTGSHQLMQLPRIREEKENKYIDVAHAHRREKSVTKKTTTPPPKPYLYNTSEKLIAFAEQFGEKRIARFIHDCNKDLDMTVFSDVEDDLHYLKLLDRELVPIQAHANWKEAIAKCVENHQRMKVAELLPLIYDEYLMKKRLGIRLTPKSDWQDIEWPLAKALRKLILEGRRLMGEPENLDF